MHPYGTSLLFLCRQCKDSFQIIDDFIEHKKEEHSVEFRTSNCIVFEDVLIVNTCNDEEENCGMLSTVTVTETRNPGTSLNLNVPLVGIGYSLTDVDLSHSPKHIPLDPADAFGQFPISTSDTQNDDTNENLSNQDDDETCENSLQPNNHHDSEAFDLPQTSSNVIFDLKESKTELAEFEGDQEISRTVSDSDASTRGLLNPYVLLKKLSSKKMENYSRLQNQETVTVKAEEVTSDFQCGVCLQKFNSEAALQIHCSVCNIDNNKRDRYCSLCKRLFNSKWARNIHKTRAHATEEEKRTLCKFKCNVCLKRYWKKDNFLLHVESHKDFLSQTRAFECNTCGSSFLAKQHLERHQVGHALARPFQCTEPGCEKAFKRPDSRQKHIKFVHSNILELFKCSQPSCASTFKRQQHLRRHLRLSHTTKQIP